MYKLATAISLLSSPAFARSNDVLRDCPPIRKTGKGELVYSFDRKATKAANANMNYKPKIPSTTMKETVIPKSGATQTPAEPPYDRREQIRKPKAFTLCALGRGLISPWQRW